MTETTEAEWIAVTRVERIPSGRGLCVVVDETPIALFKWNDAVYAIDDRCPHMGMSLSSGDMTDGVVTCPWHGWRFRITDGAWVSCPKNRNPSFPTRVSGGVVYLQMSPPAAS
jgi:nitrite reductase (NADH) small subunit